MLGIRLRKIKYKMQDYLKNEKKYYANYPESRNILNAIKNFFLATQFSSFTIKHSIQCLPVNKLSSHRCNFVPSEYPGKIEPLNPFCNFACSPVLTTCQ